MADRFGGIPGCMETMRFPYRMQICHQTYQLQGIIHSSARGGYHFHTSSVIDNNGRPFLAFLDNLRRPSIHTLTLENLPSWTWTYAYPESTSTRKEQLLKTLQFVLTGFADRSTSLYQRESRYERTHFIKHVVPVL